MKLTIHILTVALFASSLSYSQTDKLPQEAQRIKDAYQAAIEKASAPITKAYVAQLERMKIDYTKKAKLNEAVAIDNEISQVKRTATTGVSRLSEELLKDKMAVFKAPSHNFIENWELKSDKTVIGSRPDGRWKISDKLLRVEFGRNIWCEFSLDVKEVDGFYVVREINSDAGKRSDPTLSIPK